MDTNKALLLRIAFTFSLLALTGCISFSEKKPVPVVDRTVSKRVNSGVHVVREGETLYSIAWRYGRDYRELVRINAINKPELLKPGTHIALSATASRQKIVQTSAPTAVKKTSINRMNYRAMPKGKWLWPTSGQLTATYKMGASPHHGIDISGRLGTPVYAAAEGRVVYSGSGLRGLGQLIIIKHSTDYLSAYAHNNKLLVKEGDKIKAGEKIAEMGRSDTDSVKLHFEIRQGGKPVNPLRFLAKR